jgi:hypothetical protein
VNRNHQSTSPGVWLIHAVLAGNPIAEAVLESWRVPFWASSVIVMDPAQFDAEVERGRTSFALPRNHDQFDAPVPSAVDGPEPITFTVTQQEPPGEDGDGNEADDIEPDPELNPRMAGTTLEE